LKESKSKQNSFPPKNKVRISIVPKKTPMLERYNAAVQEVKI